MQSNRRNTVRFRRNGRRIIKTFAEVYDDLRTMRGRLEGLLEEHRARSISMVGPPSYEWLLIDVACLYAGVRTFAIPEVVSTEEYSDLIASAGPTAALVDDAVAARYSSAPSTIYFGNGGASPRLDDVPVAAASSPRALDDYYTVAFSSGTQGQQRLLHVPYPDLRRGIGKLRRRSRRWWHGRRPPAPECMLVWMSFTHYLQRWMALQALAYGFDLVLSSPQRCLQDLALEQPTTMVSAPVLYQLLAEAIAARLKDRSVAARLAHRIYARLGVHRWHYDHPLRRFCDRALFREIRELYGANPEQFIWSGACIDRAALEVLDRVGVQVCGGYALSELGPISSDSRESFRMGSVGIPHRQIRLAADGEILVQVDDLIRDASQLDIDRNGYARTGDLGHLDEDGYLYVSGRKDDQIILSTGKNIQPGRIETRLMQSGRFDRVVVFSRDGVRLSAIVSPRAQYAHADADLEAAIVAVNHTLRAYEQVCEVVIAPELATAKRFTTTSHKLKRREVIGAFACAHFRPLANGPTALGCAESER